MFDFFKKLEIKKPQENIDKRLEELSKKAVTHEEMDEYLDLSQKEGVSSMSVKETKRLRELEAMVDAASFLSKDVNEFRNAAELISGAKWADYATRHEESHVKKAQELGAIFENYSMTLIREPGGKIVSFIKVLIDMPQDWGTEKKKQVSVAIAKAPDGEEDNEMSGEDIKKLAWIEEFYK